MMAIAIKVLERITLTQALGLRFWDPVSESTVTGLSVTAFPTANRDLRVTAFVNRSGTYTLRDVPLLRDVENGEGDNQFWIDHPPAIPFTVEVEDLERRFLPFSLQVLLPQRGIFQAPGITLFSAATRPIPNSLAIVRASLWDASTGRPASYAVVDVQAGNLPSVRGLADDQGRVLVATRFPEPVNFGLGSPLLASGLPIRSQTWPVSVQVRYSPQPATPFPDLSAVFAQPLAAVFADDAFLLPFQAPPLAYGQELILRSRRAVTSPPGLLSRVLILPAGATPLPPGPEVA